jgi:Secretion system C-terminal sorting domain/CARDB
MKNNFSLIKKVGIQLLMYSIAVVVLPQHQLQAQTVIEVPVSNIYINKGSLDITNWHEINDVIFFDFFIEGSRNFSTFPAALRNQLIVHQTMSKSARLVPITEVGRQAQQIHGVASSGAGSLGRNGNLDFYGRIPWGYYSGLKPTLVNGVPTTTNGIILNWYTNNWQSLNLPQPPPNFYNPDFITKNVFPNFFRFNFKIELRFGTDTPIRTKSLGKENVSVSPTFGEDYSLYYEGFDPKYKYTYSFINSNYEFVGLPIETQRYDWIFNKASFPDASAIQLQTPFSFETFPFQNNDFSGVDFTNLKVSGLDVDKTTGLVNFILKGDQTTGNGANVTAEGNLQKKIFLQALTVPTSEWFVSLDNNPSPVATASTAFKQTDMADIFFKADVDMKKDMFTYFYNGQGDVSVVAKWLQILAASNSTMLNSLVGRGVNVIPNLTIRGVIVPQVANNNQLTGKMNIEDSYYDVNITFPTASINTGVASLTAEESSFLNGANWTAFVNWLNQRKVPVATTIRDRINTSALPNYKKLKDILPVLVAAKWYKDAPASIVPNKQFAYIIDRRLTGTAAPGLNLNPSVAWNQTYWNGQANQLLGSIAVNVPSGSTTISGSFNITGGVDIYNVTLANTAMSNDVATRNADAVRSNYVNSNGNYINGGSQVLTLPSLMPDNIYIVPTGNLNIPLKTFASTDVLNFSFDLRNLGLASSPSTTQIDVRVTNLVTNVTTTYYLDYTASVASGAVVPIAFALSNIPPSRYRMQIVVDPGNLIAEGNEFDNNIAVEYVVLQDQDCSAGGIAFNAAVNANNLDLTSCKVTMQGGTVSLTGNGNLTALHQGVFLKDGFKYTATATSRLLAKSVFAYTNTASNLFGRTVAPNQSDIVVNDLITANENLDKPLGPISITGDKIKLMDVKASMISQADLAKEVRNYLQQSAYRSIYTIAEPLVESAKPENKIPEDITALRNLKDNIHILKLTYTDGTANAPEFWTVAPNPVMDFFEITFNTPMEGEVVSARLLDASGKEWMQLFNQLKLNKGILKKQINIAALPPGLYIINIVTQSNSYSSKVIIKK